MLARELESTFHSLSSTPRSLLSSFITSLLVIGLLERPWKHISKPFKLSILYILAKCDYSLYANICESSKNTTRFSAILNSGAGSSFICFSELPLPLRERSKPLKGSLTIRNSSIKTVPLLRKILLVVQVSTSQTTLTFLVAKQLEAEVILG